MYENKMISQSLNKHETEKTYFAIGQLIIMMYENIVQPEDKQKWVKQGSEELIQFKG